MIIDFRAHLVSWHVRKLEMGSHLAGDLKLTLKPVWMDLCVLTSQ